MTAEPPRLGALLREDIQAVFDRDPAARSVAEVVFNYPGLHAIWFHRLAHLMWRRGLRFWARLLSQISRALTGIEIHPGATIGRRFVIDHGMGVVIGETTLIGNDVLLYQGVTLGGTSLEKKKRHPTLEDGVLVGAAATILGAVTIGRDARIGAGAIVVQDVPPGAIVVGVAARIIDQERGGEHRVTVSESDADHDIRVLEVLVERVDDLESRLKGAGPSVPPDRAGNFSSGAGI